MQCRRRREVGYFGAKSRTQCEHALVLGRATGASKQMLLEQIASPPNNFAVGVGSDQRCRFVAIHRTPVKARSQRRYISGERGSKPRARASRDITVPTGMSVMRAISLYDNSSSSRKIMTSR